MQVASIHSIGLYSVDSKKRLLGPMLLLRVPGANQMLIGIDIPHIRPRRLLKVCRIVPHSLCLPSPVVGRSKRRRQMAR